MLIKDRKELPEPLWERQKMDLIVRKNGRWPLATKEGVLGMITGVWSWRCGMCFAPVFRGETFRVVLGRGVRSTPASDDGVHLVSGPGSLLSLEKQHLADPLHYRDSSLP